MVLVSISAFLSRELWNLPKIRYFATFSATLAPSFFMDEPDCPLENDHPEKQIDFCHLVQ